MPIQYIIEGNLVKEVKQTVLSEARAEDFIKHLTSLTPLELDFCPKGLRSIRTHAEDSSKLNVRLIVEQEPTMRHLKYKNCNASHNDEAKIYKVQIPYALFWFDMIRTIHLDTDAKETWNALSWGQMWLDRPFQGADQPAWNPRMPNMFDNTRVCHGTVRQSLKQSLGQFVDTAINQFWTSEFNKDISWYSPKVDGTADNQMKEWVKASEDDWLNWPMWERDTAQTVSHWVDKLLGTDFATPVLLEGQREIPAMEMVPTFENIEGWLNTLDTPDRERLKWVLNNE